MTKALHICGEARSACVRPERRDCWSETTCQHLREQPARWAEGRKAARGAPTDPGPSQAVAVAATTRHPPARMITLTLNRPTLFEKHFMTALSHSVTKMHEHGPVCFAWPQAEFGYFFGSFWWEELPGRRGGRNNSSSSSTNDNTDTKSTDAV